MTFESFFNNLVGICVLLSHIVLLVFIIGYIYFKVLKNDMSEFMQDLWEFLESNALLLSFIFVIVGIIGSLIYSNILNIPACPLCWVQRAVIYPQVIILGLALYNKKYKIYNYILGLNAIGFVVGVYQYVMQMISYSGPCPIGGTVSCFGREVFIFNYITIPLMSVTLMVFVVLLVYIDEKKRENERVAGKNIQKIETSE